MTSVTFELETRFDSADALRSAFGETSLHLKAGAVLWLFGEISLGASVSFEGECRIEGPTSIEQGSILSDSRLGAGSQVRPYSVVRDFIGGRSNLLGPFCFLRDGCIAGDHVILGAHVEAARSRLGAGVKVSHRAFLGDAEIGDDVIIGAGVVFCNYDGKGRQPSTIGAGATIGSGSLLVAPAVVGRGAIVAAGSVVTKDIPDHGKLLQKR